MSMSEDVKMRTITITGLFGIDRDGDPHGQAGQDGPYIYGIHSLMKNPKYTWTMEDARRALPTEQDALIRATVRSDHRAYHDQLLQLRDADDQFWWVIGGELDGDWIGTEEIDDDWVELVPAQS